MIKVHLQISDWKQLNETFDTIFISDIVTIRGVSHEFFHLWRKFYEIPELFNRTLNSKFYNSI